MSDSAYAPSGRDRKVLAQLAEPVLIIDDSRSLRLALGRMLNQIGIEAYMEAESAETAFRLIRQFDFNLIICDIHMEPVSGWQFQRILRSAAQTRKIPFVLMTTSMSAHYAIRAKNEAAAAYVLKPFSARQLHAKILEALQVST